MKKSYVKPYIVAETFQLDAAIAAACSKDGKMSLGYNIDGCTLEDDRGTKAPGLGYFGDLCDFDIKVEGDGNDEICYHGPTPANTMFMNS